MALPEILVIRHGETEWNREGRMQGALDSPLTQRGEDQARAVGALLRELGVTAQSHDFLTSPQGRSRRTAALSLEPLGALARPEPLLGEIGMGAWAGLSRAEIAERWPAAHPHETDLDFYARAPGGEHFEALWDRIGALLRHLKRPSVLFTHGITSRFLRTRAMGLEMSALADLPGGQGVINRVRDGRHDTLVPATALAPPRASGYDARRGG